MIAAEAFASIAIAPILPFIFLLSRKVRDRLPIASDRLPPALAWMPMTIEKKFVSLTGTRCAIFSTASDSGRPSAWPSTILRNSDRTGSGDLVGDDAQRVAERQAGLDAAHDDVERVGKYRDELVDAARAKPGQHEIGKAEPLIATTRAGQQRASAT